MSYFPKQTEQNITPYNIQDKKVLLVIELQSLGEDHLSTSLRFFSLPLGDETQWHKATVLVVIQATMYLPVQGIKLRWSVYWGEWLIH